MNPLAIPDQPWADRAACRAPDVNADWFHPHDSDTTRAALSVCSSCPVKAACLDHALTANETLGVWGGLTADRRAALKKRGRRIALKGANSVASGPDSLSANGKIGTSTNDPRRGASTPAGDLTATQPLHLPGGIVATPQDTRVPHPIANGKGTDAP